MTATADSLNKKELSERDICTKFITPAIRDVAKWSEMQFLEEFTLGKIHVRGRSVEVYAKRELGLHEFPSPEELWQRYKAWKDIKPDEEKVVTQLYFLGDKPPRVYQQVAINRTVEVGD